MKQQHRSAHTQKALVAGLVSLSLVGCSAPVAASRVHAGGRSAAAAKATIALAAEGDTYDSAAIQQLLGTLTYADADVSISLDEIYLEVRDGRVIVWHDYEIPNWEDVPEVMQRESRRCLALACALRGSSVANTTGGTAAFQSVTWVLADGHGNNYFALVDDGDVAYSATRPYDLFPQSDGYLLSDTIYVAISRRESGIPPRSGQAPCDINGNGIICTGWLSVPDEMWTVGLPETSENTDDTGYWYDEEIEIDAPITWYQEFIDAEAENTSETDVVVVDDGSTEQGEGPTEPVEIIDPENGEGTTDPTEPTNPGEIVDPGGEGGSEEPSDPGEIVDPDTGGDGGEGGGENLPPEVIDVSSTEESVTLSDVAE